MLESQPSKLLIAGSIPVSRSMVRQVNESGRIKLPKEDLSRSPNCCSGSIYEGKSKLAALMGDEIFNKIAAKVIIDFGCGGGADAVEMAGRGAKRVIGIDIRENILQVDRRRSARCSKYLCLRIFNEGGCGTSSFPWTPLSISPTQRESCLA
jgi:2-polyprenyl-3-methyl-5-hydroxy-6-metoxy-1,4-benzoquinol methylase